MWRGFDDSWPVVLQIEVADGIDRLGVGCQQYGLGIHQAFPYHQLVRFVGTKCPQTLTRGDLANGHELRQVHLDSAIEFRELEQPFSRVAGRVAVLELKVAGAGFQGFVVQPSVGLYVLRVSEPWKRGGY
ncbi:hypothetical protein D3C87_1335680 [compost metagenome]